MAVGTVSGNNAHSVIETNRKPVLATRDDAKVKLVRSDEGIASTNLLLVEPNC